MTTTYPDTSATFEAAEGVYAPQADSLLLIEALEQTRLAPGRRVLDLCTGTGVVALAAAQQGAASVTAFDICPRAVACTRANATAMGLAVDARLGSWSHALGCRPYDLVVANPPYVPIGPATGTERIPVEAGPPCAWNAGADGRLVLDPICEWSWTLLQPGGSMLLVQSEVSDVARSLRMLRSACLHAEVVLVQRIPFGPVMSARAQWLRDTARLHGAGQHEKLVVIRADKR